jgi:hypothetical protein
MSTVIPNNSKARCSALQAVAPAHFKTLRCEAGKIMAVLPIRSRIGPEGASADDPDFQAAIYAT